MTANHESLETRVCLESFSTPVSSLNKDKCRMKVEKREFV